MRIVLNGMLLNREFCGVEHAILSLARSLSLRGRHEYRWVCPRGSQPPDWNTPCFRTLSVAWPAQFRILRILWEQVVLPRLVSRISADLLHCPGYTAPWTGYCPIVLTIYDTIALRFPRLCRPANRLHFGLLLPLSARRAAGIVVPSESTRHDVIRLLGVHENRVRVIPLGVDERFRPVRDAAAAARLRSRYALPDRFLLFVGQQDPKKNLPRLLDAFVELKRSGDWRHGLVVAGGHRWSPAHLIERARAAGVDRDVVFTGYVPDEDLVHLYNMAEVFVFPSLYEGFGLPVLEAMACGVPVVASSAGALPEVAGDAAVLTDPGRSDAIARSIRNVLRSDSLRKDLARRGLEHSARFSWNRTAELTENYYDDVLSASPVARRGACLVDTPPLPSNPS